jgi:uncharacterized protein YbjT (DUF2867 family)
MAKMAVAGGTGVVGRHVVARLTEAGHEVSVLARSTGVDVYSGAGLPGALDSVTAVIDVANTSTSRRRAAVDFFDRATRNLLAAERAAGVAHHVVLSIVGIDRVNLGYYHGKRRQEELVRGGDVPWTILRSTQFHEFAEQVAARLPGPVLPVPSMATQPVAAGEVAQLLAELAGAEPAGDTPELAGPEVLTMPDMVRRLLRARGSRRPVLPIPAPGRLWPADGLLPQRPHRTGEQTFAEWLARSGADPASRR